VPQQACVWFQIGVRQISRRAMPLACVDGAVEVEVDLKSRRCGSRLRPASASISPAAAQVSITSSRVVDA
jgi:hypothetical protein